MVDHKNGIQKSEKENKMAEKRDCVSDININLDIKKQLNRKN